MELKKRKRKRLGNIGGIGTDEIEKKGKRDRVRRASPKVCLGVRRTKEGIRRVKDRSCL